jgi:hypothetical protein
VQIERDSASRARGGRVERGLPRRFWEQGGPDVKQASPAKRIKERRHSTIGPRSSALSRAPATGSWNFRTLRGNGGLNHGGKHDLSNLL